MNSSYLCPRRHNTNIHSLISSLLPSLSGAVGCVHERLSCKKCYSSKLCHNPWWSWKNKQTKMKKSAQRRCKHCALAVVRRRQKFSPRRRPLPGGPGRPKFNELEMVTSFTYRPSLVKIDARYFELSWYQCYQWY